MSHMAALLNFIDNINITCIFVTWDLKKIKGQNSFEFRSYFFLIVYHCF